MKLVTSYVNFARGQADRDMNGRFDLPLYMTTAEIMRNFKSNFKGNALYRTGYEQMLVFQDCAFIEFEFSINQTYIVVAYANKFRFLSYDSLGNFGWVLDGSSAILEIATPYSLDQAKQIAKRKQYTQNDDAMQITLAGFAPRSLRRLSANSFELVVTSLKHCPFNLTYQATKTITAITNATNAQITVAAHGYVAGDTVRILAVVGMTGINNYTVGVVSVVDANNFTVSLNTTDTTIFAAYSSAGTAEKVLTASYPNLCRYYGPKLYYAATPLKITTIWGSEDAEYDHFEIPTSVLATSALEFTLAEISQEILSLYAGENSLIAFSAAGVVAINGGDINKAITAETIDTTLTSAPPASEVFPVSKDGFIFYMDSVKRRMLYFSYDLLTEKFKAEDANKLSYEITKGGIGKLRYKRDKEDFIYGLNETGTFQTLSFNAAENIIGWHSHTTEGTFIDIAQITDNNGAPQIFMLALRNSVYYIEREAEFVEFAKPEEFLTDDEDADKEAYYRLRAEQLKDCIYLDNAQITSNLKSNLITYDSGTGRVTATSAVFSAGDVGKEIVYQTLTGYESGRFEITGYVSTTIVEVDVLQEPTANSYTNWFLTFSTITGLSSYNGQTLSVVADGAYYDDVEVSGGEIVLDKEVTHAVIGFGYTGIIKTFILGVIIQQYNTQQTFKVLNRLALRTTTSMGGKFGSSYYTLKDVQTLKQGDLNYLPARPLDGTETLPYLDKHEIDKQLYIVQDLPLPFTVTSVIVESDQSVTTG